MSKRSKLPLFEVFYTEYFGDGPSLDFCRLRAVDVDDALERFYERCDAWNMSNISVEHVKPLKRWSMKP
jgi:hypothetical protein